MGLIGKRVLIVDDDADARAAYQTLLSSTGFDAHVADCSEGALEMALRAPPDLVIAHRSMPGLDALGLLAALRARDVRIPMILITATDDVAIVVDAIRAGAADYLVKPIDPDALLGAIDRALHTDALVREASVLRARNEALAREAEESLRAREQLLAIVAHDLRGSLAAMTMASCPPRDLEQATRRMNLVRRSVARMSTLVEDLLDVSRVDSGNMLLELVPVTAAALLDELKSATEAVADENGVQVKTTVEDELIVQCAPERVQQILSNLTINAIHVSSRGGKVSVHAAPRAGYACFTVEDEGPGIAAERLPYVLERGFRTDTGRRRGSGLGLTIAKGLAEAHGGWIDVESRLGTGTVFTVGIPLTGAKRASWRVVSTPEARDVRGPTNGELAERAWAPA